MKTCKLLLLALCCGCISASAAGKAGSEAPRIVNIVNFIRNIEPRSEEITETVLYETVARQAAQLAEYGLPATFLLQYDALINPRYRKLLTQDVYPGTEVGGCNFTGTLHHPLRPGSFGARGLGAGVDIVDDSGQPAGAGQVGELVLRNPNIGFTKSLWRDDERYLDSYWRTIPGVWVHGDFAMRDEDGLFYILGRSDDTIKVSGKRTGPSEIETLLTGTGKVSEAAVIGVPDEIKGSAIVCVCVPMPGVAADAALQAELSQAVIHGMGASYRPRQVLLVSDLPKTRNMKIMRRVVRAVYKGDSPGDLSSLVNPETVAELQGKLAG